jgi:hypothetical protein
MNEDYLDRVLDQLVGETTIDYAREIIHIPFTKDSFPLNSPYLFFNIFIHFTKHTRDYYGLTEEEIKYVWEQWKYIIQNKYDEL